MKPNRSTLSPRNVYLKKNRHRKQLILALKVLIGVLFLFIWEWSAKNGWINAFIFSSPSRIFHTIQLWYQEQTLFLHVSMTFLETISSFFLVMVFGLLVALLFWRFPILYEALEPYLILINSLPKSALAPVLIVWLGNRPETIVVVAVSLAIFSFIMTMYHSFLQIDPEKIRLIQTMNGTNRHIIRKVLLPASIPTLINNMKINIGLCLVGVIIGEFLAAKKGLGYLIIYGSQVFKMDYVMTSIFLLCLFSICFYLILSAIERCYYKRYLREK